MPQLYLYCCTSCQKEIEISEKLAGMEHSCPFCGYVITLPGMREIRQLPLKDPESSSTSSVVRSGMSETGSWLFSGGLLVAVVSGLLGLALFLFANSLKSESTVNEQIKFGNDQIEQLPSGLLWDAWDQMTINGLPDWTETHDNKYNKQALYLSYFAYALFGIAAMGFVAVGTALMNRSGI